MTNDVGAAADAWFHSRWRDLRDDCSTQTLNRVLEALELARVVGLFTPDQVELWILRLAAKCPGHDDEGGRSWCAYCGNLPAVGGT